MPAANGMEKRQLSESSACNGVSIPERHKADLMCSESLAQRGKRHIFDTSDTSPTSKPSPQGDQHPPFVFKADEQIPGPFATTLLPSHRHRTVHSTTWKVECKYHLELLNIISI